MTNQIWKMCVVGLMLASPVICTATTITDALAAAGDGKYVRMDVGSSIELTFDPPVTFGESGGDIMVYLSGLSKSIRIWSGDWYNDFYDESGYDGAWQVWLPEGTLSSLTIMGVPEFSDFVAYLDAVEVLGTGQLGEYADHGGTVKAFPAPAPVVTGISIEPTALGSEAAVEAAFTDEDGGTHTATIDWGDDTDETIVECAVGCGTVSVVHTYADPGVYTVTVEVTDSDDGTGSDTAYAPVYDPDAWSWVTGAGWYPEEGVPCGKAFFGFVCRQSAGHAPLGEMRLRWGQNRFESTGYEWLVVSTDENTAWFGGTGTINGQGDYDFLVEVADAENEIWITIDDEDGNEYYDNDGPLSIDGGLIRIRCWD